MTTPNTTMHPNSLGNGSLKAVLTEAINRAVTTDNEYLIGLSFNPENIPGGSPAVQPKNGTVTVTGSASANTATVVLRVENCDATGSANSDVVFTITVGAAKVDWSSGAATAYCVKDLIDLINEDDAGGTSGKFLQGFKAWIKDARYDLPINGANMLVTEAEKSVMPGGNSKAYTYAVPRDLSQATVNSDICVYKRIGFPEPRDRGLFEFLDIWGTVTGTTNGAITIMRDDVEDFVAPSGTYTTDIANHEVLYELAPASLSAARGSSAGVSAGKNAEPECWRGPVVVEIRSDNLSATSVKLLLRAVN